MVVAGPSSSPHAHLAGGVRIRRAVLADIDEVMELNLRNLPENYYREFFVYHLENWPDAFIVAEAPDGRLVGYIMSRVETGIGYLTKFITNKGHVISIAVDPPYRRRGIAQALLTTSMKAMKEKYGGKEVFLEVRVSNTPAIKLYEKLGFKKIKRIIAYYSDGEDAYIMAKPL